MPRLPADTPTAAPCPSPLRAMAKGATCLSGRGLVRMAPNGSPMVYNHDAKHIARRADALGAPAAQCSVPFRLPSPKDGKGCAARYLAAVSPNCHNDATTGILNLRTPRERSRVKGGEAQSPRLTRTPCVHVHACVIHCPSLQAGFDRRQLWVPTRSLYLHKLYHTEARGTHQTHHLW